MRGISRWTTIVCGAVLAGCNSGLEPTARATAPVTGPSLLMRGSGPVVQSARGAGHFTVGGELRTFSFTALKYADGTVQGEYQLFSRAFGTRIHGDVVCLTLVGNRAWIGGRQEHGSDGFPSGLENGFRVADNGEGANDPPDQMSPMFVNADPGFAQDYCNFQFGDATPALRPIEAGNIQVRD